jgi:iron complex outermembrane receptor protein
LALPEGPVDPTFKLGYRYQSSVNFNLFGDPLTVQEGFGVWNAAIGVKSHSGTWDAELFVNNLFNRNYYASVARDLEFLQPAGGVALSASYARDSFRYFGGRVNFKF